MSKQKQDNLVEVCKSILRSPYERSLRLELQQVPPGDPDYTDSEPIESDESWEASESLLNNNNNEGGHVNGNTEKQSSRND